LENDKHHNFANTNSGGEKMRKNEVIYKGELTGTISEAKERSRRNKPRFEEEFAEEFDPIQQTWRVNPVEEENYNGTIGYKDS
jgi:hypothetical protein